MRKITYVEASGRVHSVDVAPGLSVMEGAIRNNIPNIDAICGGALACATCHVYVEEAWLEKTGVRLGLEVSMLEVSTAEMKANSRLSCQIKVTDKLDGLIVKLPVSQ